MDDLDGAVLAARGLRYEYDGGACALDGLDLTVRAGLRHALVGANGAGKTTLFLHLNGTLRPRSGTVFVDGRPGDYTRAGLSAWRQVVGMVFQNPDDQLFAGSVAQDVSFGPFNLGLSTAETRARVTAALEALEISHLGERPTHMLSFGQKKRVSIAGAVAMRPRVLIIDEPLSGLDPRGADQFLGVLRDLHTSGTTVVIATHDMALAYEWADRVSIVKEGRILASGAPDDVMTDAAMLEDCGLRRPWVLDLDAALRTAGLLPEGRGPLRSRDEVIAAVAALRRGSAAAVESRR